MLSEIKMFNANNLNLIPKKIFKLLILCFLLLACIILLILRTNYQNILDKDWLNFSKRSLKEYDIIDSNVLYGMNKPAKLWTKIKRKGPKTKFNGISGSNISEDSCNFDYNVERCPDIPSNLKNRIIVVSHQRTGSSFTGDILQRSSNTFYMYEPFGYLKPNEYLDQSNNEDKLNIANRKLINAFNCKLTPYGYGHIFKYLRFFRISNYHYNPSNLGQIIRKYCASSKNLIFKFVRIDLKYLIQFYEKEKALSGNKSSSIPFKTLVLFRDPRAIMNSRLDPRLGWCSLAHRCRDPRTICERIRSNLKTLINTDKIPKEILDGLVLLRYEDLAKQTSFVTKQLFMRLGLNYTNSVENYVRHKTTLLRGLRGSKRNTTQNAISWLNTFTRRKMNLNEIQEHCSDVMKILGYNSLNESQINYRSSWNQIISSDFPLKRLLKQYFIESIE